MSFSPYFNLCLKSFPHLWNSALALLKASAFVQAKGTNVKASSPLQAFFLMFSVSPSLPLSPAASLLPTLPPAPNPLYSSEITDAAFPTGSPSFQATA